MKKRYPLHPCVTCLAPTTNKTYCDTHLSLLKTPGYTAKRDPHAIVAEMDIQHHNQYLHRRHET